MNTTAAEITAKVIPILKESGVTRSSLFGSVARGEAGAGSDVDLLVELPLESSLLDLVDLQLKLESVLHRRVDVLTYKSISPLLKPYIEPDEQRIL